MLNCLKTAACAISYEKFSLSVVSVIAWLLLKNSVYAELNAFLIELPDFQAAVETSKLSFFVKLNNCACAGPESAIAYLLLLAAATNVPSY